MSTLPICICNPVVVAGVPGEGDTRPGSSLPPTTMDEKRLIKQFWADLADRYPEEKVGRESLQPEFDALDAYLDDLRALVKEVSSKR